MKENQIREGYELNDKEIKDVSGGSGVQMMRIACPHCGKINNVNVMSDSYMCNYCKTLNTISG